MCAQTRPRFILSSEGVLGGMEFEPMLTPREKSPLPEKVPRGLSNPRRCGQRAQALPTEIFRPQPGVCSSLLYVVLCKFVSKRSLMYIMLARYHSYLILTPPFHEARVFYEPVFYTQFLLYSGVCKYAYRRSLVGYLSYPLPFTIFAHP